MRLEDVRQLISEKTRLIEVDAKSLNQARERASDFLMVSALLLTYLKDLETQIVKVRTMQQGSEANAILEAHGKNITEKKNQALLDKEFIKYRELYETLEAQKNWIKGFIKIFENAHLMYRQYSKE
jgi:hypothetical protein